MKLYKRLLSLLLVCFVCFGLFSVNALAVEDTDNLISINFYQDWQQISSIDSKYDDLTFSAGTRYNGIKVPSGVYIPGTSAFVGAAYTLPNLTVGDNYELFLPFVFQNPNNLFSVSVGFGYLNNEGFISPFAENSNIIFSESVGNYSQVSNYDFKYSFEYKENPSLGVPCVYVSFISNTNDFTTTSGTNFYLYYESYLKRIGTPTEQKLDGILGWLEDIKNTIVSLPNTLKTTFNSLFTNLENKINDFKNTVTEKFTTLSTEFSSYITNLGNNIKGFFDDFWENISKWFEKFKPRIDVKENIENIEIQHNNYVWFEYTVPDGCVFTLDYFGKSSSSDYIRIGDYYGFASNTAKHYLYSGDSIELPSGKYYFHWVSSSSSGFNSNNFLNSFDIYCDSGWFSYFSYTLKDNLNSIKDDIKLKIDLKIEEIKQNLHDLFIPSEGYFDELSERFDLLIEERFGALVTITDYLVDFFSSFNADVTKEFFDVPIININLMGYNFPVGGWQVRFVPQFNGVEILTNACKFISSVLATFAFFDGLKNKYHEVFGGGE